MLHDIVRRGVALNYEWVKRNPNREISQDMSPMIFYDDDGEGIETCCEITANAISDALGVKNWKRTELNLVDSLRLNVPLRVEMGYFSPEFKDQLDSPNHVVIIVGDEMADSFFEHRAITLHEFSHDLKKAFQDCDYEKILKVGQLEHGACDDWIMRVFIPQ